MKGHPPDSLGLSLAVAQKRTYDCCYVSWPSVQNTLGFMVKELFLLFPLINSPSRNR